MTWINSSLDWQVSPIIKSACQLSARYHEGIFEGGGLPGCHGYLQHSGVLVVSCSVYFGPFM